MIARIRDKAIKLGINWAAIKFAFACGCIVGMIVEAVLITVPRVAMAVLP